MNAFDVIVPAAERTRRAHMRGVRVAAPARDRGWAAQAVVLVRACRPRQWTKNVLVAAAPGAAGVMLRPRVATGVFLALLVFCLVASATYLLNDVRDREQDRLHPRKRLRPVAAGLLTVPSALLAAGLLAAGGLVLGVLWRPALGAVAGAYLLLTASYSLWWRRVVVLDILAVAAGFVLRALAGGVAAGVALSGWFALVASAGALFLVAGKRYAELRDLGPDVPARPTLRRYSPQALRLLLGAAMAVACVAYALWALRRPEYGPWYELTLAPFFGWLAVYAARLGAGAGQAPEELILRDRALLGLGAVWLVLFVGGLYVGQ